MTSTRSVNRQTIAAGQLALLAVLLISGQQISLANPEVSARMAVGVWRSLIAGGTNTFDFYGFPLTSSGQERYESFPLDQDPALRCEPPGMPRAFYYLSLMDFSFQDDTVRIRYETMDVIRTVHMYGMPLAPDATHTPDGYSVGRWDGDALVVDTTHLAAGETTRDGIPKSDAMTLTETIFFEDGHEDALLSVTTTITDPENFAEPFTSVHQFENEPDWELLPFDCHQTEY